MDLFMKKNYLYPLVLVAFASSLPAQDSLTLRQFVQSATTKHYAVRKSGLETQLQQEKVISEAKAALSPQVSAQFGADYNPFLPATVLTSDGLLAGAHIPVRLGLPWQANGIVTAEQLVYNASYRKMAPAQQLGERIVQLLAEKSKDEATFQVAQLFLQIKQTEAMGMPLEPNRLRLVALEKSVAAAVSNGMAVKTDLKRIESALQMLQLQKQQLAEALTYQRALLGFVSGVDIPSSAGLKNENMPIQLPQNKPALVEKRLLEQQIAQSNIKVSALEAERFPEVKAIAQVGLQAFRARPFGADGGWYGAGLVGLRARWNILDGGKLSSKKRQMLIEKQKITLDMEQLDAVQRIESEYAEKSLKSAEQQVLLHISARTLAEEIWQGLQLQYREGTIALKEVLEAQTALVDAETKLAMSQVAVQQAKLKLLKVTGQLGVLEN
jgi:outer membrane protein